MLNNIQQKCFLREKGKDICLFVLSFCRILLVEVVVIPLRVSQVFAEVANFIHYKGHFLFFSVENIDLT